MLTMWGYVRTAAWPQQSVKAIREVIRGRGNWKAGEFYITHEDDSNKCLTQNKQFSAYSAGSCKIFRWNFRFQQNAFWSGTTENQNFALRINRCCLGFLYEILQVFAVLIIGYLLWLTHFMNEGLRYHIGVSSQRCPTLYLDFDFRFYNYQFG